MKLSSSSPRYDLCVNPPYQINYRAKRAGKHISASKRRVTFQFGFSSARAVAAGGSGNECRGEEHEVVLVWSHITGKRQLFMDGREVHASRAGRGNMKFEYAWGMKGGHVVKILANGTPPMGERKEYMRQFDLQLDGMSFFDFARIYELGGSRGRSSDPSLAGYSYRGVAYDSRDDEEEYVEEAPPMPEVKAHGFDLFDAPPAALSPITQQSSVPSLTGSSASSSSAASSSYDEFTPVEQLSNSQASYDSISSSILCAYNSGAPPAPASSAPTSSNSAPTSSRALVPVSEEGMDQITKSMKNLVNLDDITTAPLQPLSMNPDTSKQTQAVASWALAGRAPTLTEIRDSQVAQGSYREVMRDQPQTMQQSVQHQQYQAHPEAMMAYQGSAPTYGYQYGTSAPAGYSQAY